MPSIGQELLNVPMGDMIRQMAFAIAEAQLKLDESSIEVAEMMGGLRAIRNEEGDYTFDDSRVFFGHTYMTSTEAAAYIAADNALSGGDEEGASAAIAKSVEAQKGKEVNGQVRVPTRVSMLELGFTPTFYQFVDTIIEVKIAIKITRSSEYTRARRDTRTAENKANSNSIRLGRPTGSLFGVTRGNTQATQVSTSQVDASYSSKYSYTAEGSSLLRTKLSPVPPPPILEERIRAIVDMEAERRAATLPKPAPSPSPGG
ncbi:ribosomal protein S12 methylthiotransferase rimO [Croceibacterium mercuriale]|uniref:Ribosomal protein S12 methylthiotransferase rimO n=1 Tax=Croceibacterium mercuriale TaxID=1572751 RepID=A0A0B2C3H0_9SPHN|nr:hypothetical protein [Croceibacterium mercuriale]KHL26581.1 ribosomal protein S12 methylthiotransferase rimO [Croceibacterium mercuriale]